MPKFDLAFTTPYMNAASSLGFYHNPDSTSDIPALGAFITNPISLRPRSPARGTRLLRFPGGFLLHSGYANPGLKAVIKHYAAYWGRAAIPIIVHLLGEAVDQISEMVVNLESIPGVAGIELSLPPKAGPDTARALVRAALGELPVILHLPNDRAPLLASAISGLSGESLPAAISLGPPRGVLPGPEGGHIQGRMYGPAVFPLALAAVHAMVEAGWPVIGGGGIYSKSQAEAMRAAGAMAVQLDAVYWRGGANL